MGALVSPASPVKFARLARAKDPLLSAAIVASIVLTACWACAGGLWWSVHGPLPAHAWTHPVVFAAIAWALLGVALLALRTAFWFAYRDFAAPAFESAPALTVIIPAYNEGAMVQQSIDSVANARYPRERLEILVVDDGSRDDTWIHIQAAAARHPGLVTTLRFSENRGKRAALEAGFRRAKGEIVATIDSDSVIDAQTLLALVGPFADPRVGAVAGRVNVYNRQRLIPRMLHVRYTLSFDFLRAAQSGYRTVYCCPGALAGYRASVVREVLEPWLRQSFLGAPCTYGEDRSMTNFILGRGYDAVYQRSAVVHTLAPVTYTRLCKMYLRWDRSYVREELRFFARIVWRRPWRHALIALFDVSVTNLRFPVGYASLLVLADIAVTEPLALLRLLLAMGLMASLSMLYYLRSERSWDFVYGIVYAYYSFFALLWVFPYAAMTVRSRAWMTR